MIETVLGFDFGRTRIGVAVGNVSLGHASGLGIVNAKPSPDWRAIDQLVAQWRPDALVVGLPMRGDSAENHLAQAALAFTDAVRERAGLPAYTIDERLSSREAQAQLRDARRRGERKRRVRKGDTDKLAATIILLTWMSHAKDID